MNLLGVDNEDGEDVDEDDGRPFRVGYTARSELGNGDSMDFLGRRWPQDGARFLTHRSQKKNFRSRRGQKKILTQIICIYVNLLFKLH